MLNLIYRFVATLARARSGRALLSATVFISFAAAAQTAERDPLNAQTATPHSPYQSAFSDYKPYQDPELISWKTANDVVREFGGMAGMGGMEDMKSTDNPDANPGGGEQHNQPAPKAKSPPPLDQPAAPMPGHSGMSH